MAEEQSRGDRAQSLQKAFPAQHHSPALTPSSKGSQGFTSASLLRSDKMYATSPWLATPPNQSLPPPQFPRLS